MRSPRSWINNTQSLEQVQTSSNDARAREDLKLLGSIDTAPGASAVGLFMLTKPGRDGMACFIPQGTTSREQHGNSRRHVELGMLAELTVEAT
jgi:hypothetical protein